MPAGHSHAPNSCVLRLENLFWTVPLPSLSATCSLTTRVRLWSVITPKPDCQDRHYGLCFSIRLIVRAFLDPDRGLAASTVPNTCCQVELSILPDVADLWVYSSLLFGLWGVSKHLQRRVYGIDGILRIPTQ